MNILEGLSSPLKYQSEKPKTFSAIEIAEKVSHYVVSALIGATLGVIGALVISGIVASGPLLIGASVGLSIALIAKGLYDLFKAYYQKSQAVDTPSKLQTLAAQLEEQFQGDLDSLALSDNQLDQILELSDQVKKELTHHNQVEQLRQRLESKIGPQRAQEALTNQNILPSQLHDPRSNLDDALIDNFVQTADNYFYNQEIMAQLRQDFAGETAALDKAFTQIGIDDFIKGKRRLTDEIKTQIVELARKIQSHEKFDDLLVNLKSLVERGDVLLDDKEIEKRFHVSTVLQPLSEAEQAERRDKLKKIVVQAHVNRELKLTTKWTQSLQNEIFLLKGLGYEIKDSSNYYNRELVHQTLSEIVQQQLQADGFKGSIIQVGKKMAQHALQARLKMAGIASPTQADKFEKTLPFLATVQAEAKAFHEKKVPLSLPANFPELAKRSIARDFNTLKEWIVEPYLNANLKKIQSDFNNDALSAEAFEQKLSKALELTEKQKGMIFLESRDALEKDPLVGQIDFASKWGSYLKREMIQGLEDEQEVFLRGVCFALSVRIIGKSQINPQASAEDVAKEVSIQPKDRFSQASYSVGGRVKIHTKDQFPPWLLKKLGFNQQKTIFTLASKEKKTLAQRFKDTACTNLTETRLASSNGWAAISLQMTEGGHAIALRLDAANNRVWLFDPNVGFFAFEQDGRSFEESREIGLECLKELIGMHYSTIQEIKALQFLK